MVLSAEKTGWNADLAHRRDRPALNRSTNPWSRRSILWMGRAIRRQDGSSEKGAQMNGHYTHVLDLAREVEPPADGILTRTLFNGEDVKMVIFGFAEGQELSEHTASMPAILQFIRGEATLTLGDDTVEAQPGTWVHMPAGLEHSVRTRTPVIMLLLLLKT